MKKYKYLLTVVGISAMLTACGGGSSSSKAEEPSTNSSEAQASEGTTDEILSFEGPDGTIIDETNYISKINNLEGYETIKLAYLKGAGQIFPVYIPYDEASFSNTGSEVYSENSGVSFTAQVQDLSYAEDPNTEMVNIMTQRIETLKAEAEGAQGIEVKDSKLVKASYNEETGLFEGGFNLTASVNGQEYEIKNYLRGVSISENEVLLNTISYASEVGSTPSAAYQEVSEIYHLAE